MKPDRYASTYPKQRTPHPPLVHAEEAIRQWFRVDLPDMDPEQWEEAKEWIRDHGYVHRVHGRPWPRPVAVAGGAKSWSLHQLVTAGVTPITSSAVQQLQQVYIWTTTPMILEEFGVSFADDEQAALFKLFWC